MLSDKHTLTKDLLGIFLNFCEKLFYKTSTNKTFQKNMKKESIDIYIFRVVMQNKRLLLFLQVPGKIQKSTEVVTYIFFFRCFS